MAGRIQITIRMSGRSKFLVIDKALPISTLFARVRKEILEVKANNTSFYLICDGEQLEEGAGGTVESLGIIHGSVLDFCQRLKGGSGRLTALPGKISLTQEPCCITYDDDPSTTRARMPCGCSISVDAMKQHCDTELEKGRCKFQCPNCRSNWPFSLVRHVLLSIMSSSQLTKLSMKINDNYFGNLSKIKQCPSCSNHCERTDESNNRVMCSVCTSKTGRHYEFCWACLNPWKEAVGVIDYGLEFTHAGLSCGNVGCNGKDARLRYLAECPTKTIGLVNDVPSVRVCQKCGNMISHITACKHMTCKCGYNFCFVCLKPQVNDEWQCGTSGAVCPVAPRQTSLQ